MSFQNKFGSILNITNDIIKLEQDYIDQFESISTLTEIEFKDLVFIKSIIIDYIYIKSIDSFQIESDDTNVKITISLLEKLFLKYVNAVHDKPDTENKKDFDLNLIQVVKDITPDIALLLNYSTFNSIKFCNKFIENNGLPVLFNYLTNSVLIESYKNTAISKKNNYQNIDNTLRRIMGSLVCLGRAYSAHKNKWKESNCVKNFFYYLNQTKEIVDNKVYSCLAIAFVADDEDIDQLPELKDILPDITKLIGSASKMIKEDTNLYRIGVQLDESSNETKEVCCVNHMGTGWSLINLLKALYHLSVNDGIKYDIYYKNSMNKYLRSIIYNGNDVEREYCLMLLWQLCFDKQIGLDVLNDSVLYEFLSKLSTDKDEAKKNVVKNASGIIWLLNNSTIEDTAVIKVTESSLKVVKSDEKLPFLKNLSTETVNKKHIMISYNRDSRDLCLKIKNELEKDGHKIWIDVEDIHGSSLESMANAIEKSVCVLMCMTEKYKQSPNCRAEAEYAFQLNKPIIPLIMQKDYKPDGWLGIILGSKIFINFMKYDLDECLRRLRMEIQTIFKDNLIKVEVIEMMKPESDVVKQNEDVNKISIGKLSNKERDKVNKVSEWTEKDVGKWLTEKKIHPDIVHDVKSFDGKLLGELFSIKNESPEFFYKSMTFSRKTYKPISLKDLAYFTSELKKIFSN